MSDEQNGSKATAPSPERLGSAVVIYFVHSNTAVGKPSGDVAYLRMPLALSAMDAMNRFVEKAYGKDCVCTEEPKGWLKISTPQHPS